jgi:hypothetical protein
VTTGGGHTGEHSEGASDPGSSAGAETGGEVCVINIGARQRARRRRLGVLFAGVSLALGAALLLGHAARSTRAWLFLPLTVAAYGVFQAREKT